MLALAALGMLALGAVTGSLATTWVGADSEPEGCARMQPSNASIGNGKAHGGNVVRRVVRILDTIEVPNGPGQLLLRSLAIVAWLSTEATMSVDCRGRP